MTGRHYQFGLTKPETLNMRFNFTTTFPTTLDSFTNPTSGQSQNSPSHSTQHANINDSVAALEAKVGINSSAVTTSHDYKLSGVTGTDKAVSKTGSETLTNKTLTSPVINVGSDTTADIYYRNSGGAFTRLPIGTANQILAVSSGLPAWIANPSAANASTTVAGIVEEATAAEITAGTATGGTGAILVVTPDQLALSTPVFSGASLTNLPFKGLFKNGTTTKNAADASTTQTIAHGLGTTPKFVTIKAISFGSSGAADSIPAFAETVYNGTTQSSVSFFAIGTSFSGSGGQTIATFTLNVAGAAPAQTDGVVTFDSTNISIAWTKTNSPTGTYRLLWTAMA